MHAKKWMLFSNRQNNTFFYKSKRGKPFFLKGLSISIHIGPAVSFTLGWVGDVPGIIQYMIWFEEQTKTTYFLILWVFTISTQPSFLKNCSGDSQFNSDKFSLVNPWLDFWEPASFSFLEWGEKFWVRELPLGEFFSWLLFILQSLVFSPGYLSMCTLSTCLLRFLVSFVKNACQQKIFKMSIKWVSDLLMLSPDCFEIFPSFAAKKKMSNNYQHKRLWKNDQEVRGLFVPWWPTSPSVGFRSFVLLQSELVPFQRARPRALLLSPPASRFREI